MYGLQIIFATWKDTNSCVDEDIDFKSRLGFDLPFSLNGTQLIAGGASFYLAVQYNLSNIYHGLAGSKDKVYAIMCLLPWFQLYICLYLASQYS